MKITEKIVKTLHVTVFISDLIFFLKQRGALESFEQYVNWERIRISSPEIWISCGFLWHETPEGNIFWDKVNREWRDFLKIGSSGEIYYESPFIKE